MNNNKDELLFNDDRSIEDIIKEVAEEQGMTYEEVEKMYNEFIATQKKVPKKDKKKAKSKRKMVKASRKKNRK